MIEYQNPQSYGACHRDDTGVFVDMNDAFDIYSCKDPIEHYPKENRAYCYSSKIDTHSLGAEHLFDHTDGDGVGGGACREEDKRRSRTHAMEHQGCRYGQGSRGAYIHRHRNRYGYKICEPRFVCEICREVLGNGHTDKGSYNKSPKKRLGDIPKERDESVVQGVYE